MTTEQMDRIDDEGNWLRRRSRWPVHACNLPPEADDGDVWMCRPCGRMYIWSNPSGYGFWWRRVWFRYWWFRLMADSQEKRDGSALEHQEGTE